MAFYFLDPVVIANSATATERSNQSIETAAEFGGGTTVTRGESVTRSLVGQVIIVHGETSSYTRTENGTAYGVTEVLGTSLDGTSGTLAFESTSTLGETVLSTVEVTSIETTSTSEASQTVFTTTAETVTRRSTGGGTYTTTRMTAATVATSYEGTIITTAETLETHTILSSSEGVTNFGVNAVSFRYRVYAEFGEVLYVYTGAVSPGVVWPGGPGWMTTTSALIDGAPMGGSAQAGVTPGATFPFVIEDVSYSLTWHGITTVSTTRVTAATFDESITTTTTQEVTVTALSTIGPQAPAHVTLAASATTSTTVTGITTVMDFVTETSGDGGAPQTLATTATTTYTQPTFAMVETVGSGSNSLVVGGNTFRTFVVEALTVSVWSASVLRNYATATNGDASNPYGPAARLRPVPMGGWQRAGAHGPNEPILEGVAAGGERPEFAMMGGVLVATETDASVTGVRTARRTVEAQTTREGAPVLLGHAPMRTAHPETVFFPAGAAFTAPHSATELTASTFATRESTAFSNTEANPVLFETFPHRRYETVAMRRDPQFATPEDLNERVVTGPLYQNAF